MIIDEYQPKHGLVAFQPNQEPDTQEGNDPHFGGPPCIGGVPGAPMGVGGIFFGGTFLPPLAFLAKGGGALAAEGFDFGAGIPFIGNTIALSFAPKSNVNLNMQTRADASTTLLGSDIVPGYPVREFDQLGLHHGRHIAGLVMNEFPGSFQEAI